jgi:glycosyltransferase involved in cell wall biosynthesis
VNQHQCLQILGRADIALYHRDVPFFGAGWKPIRGMLSAEDEERLNDIPLPPPGMRADTCLRMGFPHYFNDAPETRRTFTFGSSEFQRIEDQAIGTGQPAAVALAQARGIITCSRWSAQGFINSGAARERISIVPHGVDPSVFRPATAQERSALRRELGWEGCFVALNVSAATPNKGLDIAMRAIALLAPGHPTLRLVLKGADHLYRSWQLLQSALALLERTQVEAIQSRITYHGPPVASSKLARLYQAADVYLAPYRAEGFNIPVLEAAACGLPVITTAGGSTDDFVDASWCRRVEAPTRMDTLGNVYLEPDARRVAEVLDGVIRDEAWRAGASRAGPEWVRNRYTWAHCVDQLLRVILPD